LNKAIFIGNLAKDPEIRRTQDGQPIANLLVATSARWRDKSGERHEGSEFHRVVIFAEGLCKIVEQFLKKGSKVYVEGSIHTRKYLDHQSGQEKFSSEVQLQT
jgi:single-strand DNA-binding protein